MKPRSDSGIALMTTMMVMLLLSALLVGFTAIVTQDSRLSTFDLGRTDAFYMAHAGLENLTTDLGELFGADFSPSGDAVRALASSGPALAGVSWLEPDGSPGYRIEFETTTGDPATGDPVASNRTITAGPYQGLLGLVTEYQVKTTAHMYNGSESSLQRILQTVSVPVFQFGTFSETDLSFFPGPVFNFGGRVHTNGNLFLAAGSSGGVQLSDKVTAVGEIVRAYLSNGVSTVTRTGPVDVVTAPGVFRDLQIAEGSVVGTIGSAVNEPTWTNLSTGTYNSYITNGRTGAKRLDLPLVTMGAQPIDLVRRPPANEDPNGPIFSQRHFGMASVRILLSDDPNDITTLPTVTATPPVRLDAQVDTGGDPLNPFAGYTVDATRPPLAMSAGFNGGYPEPGRAPDNEGYRFPPDTTSIGGFIKIEIQTTLGNWQDVTLEILSLGIAGRNLTAGCTEPNPNAVLRVERLRYDGILVQPGGGCGNGSTSAFDYWPNVLYDTREGNLRDNVSTSEVKGLLPGVMHYLELDVNNLRRWLQGAIGVSGPNALDQNGFIVYFSDRRNNRDAAGNETGEYGFEDFVNPLSSNGDANDTLDTGEDVNANGQLDTYGQVEIVPAGAQGPLDGAEFHWKTWLEPEQMRVNRAIIFRRALKLVNGGLNQVPMPGLTVTSENPVYVQGDYNASDAAGGFVEPNAATAIIADAVTLLSNNWNDMNSINSPHEPSGRPATTTWYRVAIVSGKGPSFPLPTSGGPADFGTDGGTHNFLRYLERWSGQTLNYSGAIVTFYYNRQALGTYKCCTNVYSPPVRAYLFDTDFLDPNLLPPGTPMFRDVNIMGFTYNIRAE